MAEDKNSKVVGIEVPRIISIFEKEDDLDTAVTSKAYNAKATTDYGREVDIVTGAMGKNEIWREMKSYKSKSKNSDSLAGGVSPWKWGTGSSEEDSNDQDLKGSHPHRQYILDRIVNKTFARMGKKERTSKGEDASMFNVTQADLFWYFHKFETKSSKNSGLTNIKKFFNKEASSKPIFYDDHISKYEEDSFIMGSIDLFLTNSKSTLADAVMAEVADRIVNVSEEVAP